MWISTSLFFLVDFRVSMSCCGSDLRRAIALARHRAPKCCTRRVIFSAPWSTHKQTPESGCKDTYNTSVIHVDRHHTGSSPLSKICTRYTCFCYPFSRPICRQVALSSYSICNADCHWSSPLSLSCLKLTNEKSFLKEPRPRPRCRCRRRVFSVTKCRLCSCQRS